MTDLGANNDANYARMEERVRNVERNIADMKTAAREDNEAIWEQLNETSKQFNKHLSDAAACFVTLTANSEKIEKIDKAVDWLKEKAFVGLGVLGVLMLIVNVFSDVISRRIFGVMP